MNDAMLGVLATFAAQTFGAAIVAALLYGFFRQYGKSYLGRWSASWAALAVYQCAAGIGTWLGMSGRADTDARLALAVVAAIAANLQIGWLSFGAYEIVRSRPVRLRTERGVTYALIAAGIAVGAVATLPPWPASYRFMARFGLHSLFTATVFLAAAAAFWRARRRRRFGFQIMAGGLLLYGIEQANYFAFAIAAVFAPGRDYYTYLGYIDFILQAVVGIAVLACLLEDVREAAELATVEIEHLAYHDALTGLPNRPLFMDRLIVAVAQAHRGKSKLAVLFLDLDRFKDINDSLGHSIGDTLLKSLADRIRHCVREGDTVARFGGDEFTLMIPRIDNIEDAAKIAQKIIETLKIPFVVGDRELFVTTSIGIGIYPNDGLDPETLVRNADTAMYRAKEHGRDNYQLYAPAMNARALERLALENMLRKALANDELLLHYQPLVDLASKQVLGVEALLRWQHPELGLLSPAHFISVAEVSGLIIPIGSWVLERACRQTKWLQKHIDASLTISVNLSARQFQQPDLVAQVTRALHVSGLDAAALELEITESNAMQNAENTIRTLRELKTVGVRIAMDDFGTGYSSLNYLKRFPIDTLKLDQSFVRDVVDDESDAAIVSAVIAMAHSLNLHVIAEGVETEDQLAFLKRKQCDRIQGFLFSAPMSAEELESYLTQRRAVGA